MSITEPSPRQVEVLALRAQGKNWTEIGDELQINPRTAAKYVEAFEAKAAIDAAIARERAACAKIARDEAEHQNAIYRRLSLAPVAADARARAISRAASAERIARVIERGDH